MTVPQTNVVMNSEIKQGEVEAPPAPVTATEQAVAPPSIPAAVTADEVKPEAKPAEVRPQPPARRDVEEVEMDEDEDDG